MINLQSPINIQPLLDAYNQIEQDIQWTQFGHKGKQAGLQYRHGEDPWKSAVGRGSSIAESDYCEINPFFKNTVFEAIINQYNFKRTRLMWIGPYACYSMHRDATARIHIPLITNSECYFVFKQGSVLHLPTGNVYYVDTTEFHTFINCSGQHRLHLVGVVEQ
jgi:hypothetical protein